FDKKKFRITVLENASPLAHYKIFSIDVNQGKNSGRRLIDRISLAHSLTPLCTKKCIKLCSAKQE
ncbi:unnamed protein product, partial [Didymodactylos carnosus]